MFFDPMIVTTRTLTKLPKYQTYLLFISFLLITNFLIGSYLRNDYLDRIFFGDDAINVNIAENFRKSGKFFINFTPLYPEHDVESVIKTYPEIPYAEGDKGPVYYSILALVFALLNSKPSQLLFHASILANILTSTFLIIYFILISKYFSLKSSIISSTIILFSPFIGFQSISAQPFILLLIISSLSIFFIEKKKSHYLIFGLLAGLAHLTHPYGILLGLSYCVFLLINREIKGLIITALTWHVILIPWFIRNYYYFGDIGQGFFIPFSEKLSNFLYFLPRSEIFSAPSFTFTKLAYENVFAAPNLFMPLGVLNRIFVDFIESYSMGHLIIFIIIFPAFAFFILHNLKMNYKTISWVLIIGFSFLMTIFIQDINYQIFVFFILPIIIASYFILKSNFYLKIKGQRPSAFIFLFSYFTIVAIYLYSIFFNYETPEPRFLMLPVFLLLAISIVGFRNLIEQSKLRILQNSNKIIMVSLVILLASPMIFGTISISVPLHMTETFDVKLANKFIQEEIPRNKTIAANYAFITSVRTSLPTIQLPINVDNLKEFDNYIKYYDISYLIFYNFPKSWGWTYDYDDLYYNIIKGYPSSYTYLEVYSFSNSHILRIEDVLDADISNRVAYLAKGIKLEEIGRINEANKIIFDEIRNFQYESPQKEVGMCILLTYYERYDDAINHCSLIIEKHSTNPVSLIAVHNIMVTHVNSGQIEKNIDFYKIYDILLENFSDKEIVLESWGKTFNTLISYDEDYYRNVVNEMFIDAKDFVSLVYPPNLFQFYSFS